MSLSTPPRPPHSGGSSLPLFLAVVLALLVLMAQDDAERFFALLLCGIAALLLMGILCILAAWMLGFFKKNQEK